MASTIFNSPATPSMMTNSNKHRSSVAAFIVLLTFVVTAAMLLLTLANLSVVGGELFLLAWSQSFHGSSCGRLLGYVIRIGVSSILLSRPCGRRSNGKPWSASFGSRCKPICQATLPCGPRNGLPPTRCDYRFAPDISAADMLNYQPRFSVVFYGCQYRCSSYGGGSPAEHRPRAQPRLRSSLRCSDIIRPITSALQTGSTSLRNRQRQAEGTMAKRLLGQGKWTSATDAATPAISFRRRTQGAGAKGCSSTSNHAIACSEYHGDESRHSTLWTATAQDYGQGDKQDLNVHLSPWP